MLRPGLRGWITLKHSKTNAEAEGETLVKIGEAPGSIIFDHLSLCIKQ